MGRTARKPFTFTAHNHGKTRTVARLEITGENGKRRWLTAYGSDENAALTALYAKLAQGGALKPAKPSAPSIKTFLPIWIEHCRASETQPQTITKYKRDIERHVIPYTDEPLDTYDAEAMRRLFYITMPEHGVGDFARRHTHTELRQMLAYAVESGVLAKNPMDGVARPKAKAKAGRKLDKNMTQWIPAAQFLLDWLEQPQCPYHHLYALILLTLNGLRRSEAMGLEWDAITGLERTGQCRIHVMRQLQRHSKESGLSGLYLTESTKNGDDRTFKAPERVRRALLEVKRQERQGTYLWERKLVFLNHLNHAWAHTTLDHIWKDKILPDFWRHQTGDPEYTPIDDQIWRLHDNRHICASVMAQHGVDRKAAAKILGHLDQEMTSYYTHTTQMELNSGLDAMEEYLKSRFVR